MQAITDAALAHLKLGDLLGELLDRLREIMEVDTAVMLLLDPSSQQLVATAASGIEEEVRRGIRIEIGKGFAGRIAAQRKPMVIEDVDGTKVLNRLPVTRGIRSLLGVPLVSSGTLVGVLHVGTVTTREFTLADVELLQLAADRAAMAVQSVVSQAERAAARELQRSLVPAALPAVQGVQSATRYIPGEAGVGGDWYDMFNLPSGELCVVIGDVAGHGLGAAVVMGRMRSALRAYALETRDPAGVLRKLDRKMQHFEASAMATVLYAVCHPALEWAHVSLAGHLPPVLVSPGSVASLLDISPDVPIGVDLAAPRHATTVEVPPGALVCCYTDGLIERRGSSLDTGLSALCKSISAGPPEEACAAVMEDLIGERPLEDDVAVLMLRRVEAD